MQSITNAKVTKRYIRDLLRTGEALPLNEAPEKHDGMDLVRVAHSEGVYGISGGVISLDGQLYATADRSSSLFYWF